MHLRTPLLTALTLAASLATNAPGAVAQSTPMRASPLPAEILGYDPGRRVLAYLEHTPSTVPGFTYRTIVEVPETGAPRRISLTTETDVRTCSLPRGDGGGQGCTAVLERIERDVTEARGRLQAGRTIPVMSAPSSAFCSGEPGARREQSLGDGTQVRVTVEPDGAQSTVLLVRGERTATPTRVPAFTTTVSGRVVTLPYDTVADARELPGTDRMALLLRATGCVPAPTSPPAIALLVPLAPYPERPLARLPDAALQEAAVIRALVPAGARRRTVDDRAGWYRGRVRIVFDHAWLLPSDGGPNERLLVQYAHHDADLSPLLAEAGQAPARFALAERNPRGRLRIVARFAPPLTENVFEGVSQEALTGDLNNDGRPEVIIRARQRPTGETATALRIGEQDIQFIWRGVTGADDRAAPLGARAEVRRCTLGVDGTTLVNRCTVDYYRTGGPSGGEPVASESRIQRVEWNGGALRIFEERR